jgi:ribosomal protein S18 acetylase RimI-like enzyme
MSSGWDGWRGNIYRLAVSPAYLRRGIARALVGEAERRLCGMGARRISALVESDHQWATDFWDSLGASGYRHDERMRRCVKTL